MSRYQTSHRIDGPFIDADPVAELIRFFRANGYSIESQLEGPAPESLLIQSTDEDSETDESSEPEVSGTDDISEPEVSGTDDISEPEVSGTDDISEPEVSGTDDISEPEVSGTDDVSEPEVSGNDEDREIVVSATLTRGEPGASIWTSNMAELHAVLELELAGNFVKLDYDIETTLQHFTEDDRAFWQKEARKADSFVTGKVDAIIDWRENESIRVERQQKDIVLFGIQMMIFSAIIVAILYFALM